MGLQKNSTLGRLKLEGINKKRNWKNPKEGPPYLVPKLHIGFDRYLNILYIDLHQGPKTTPPDLQRRDVL